MSDVPASTAQRRLAGRVAMVFGAGSSGPGWGNGKAAAVLYAREGAAVVCVDLVESAAEEARDIIIASDEAKYVTGACLVVDGGLSGTAFVSM